MQDAFGQEPSRLPLLRAMTRSLCIGAGCLLVAVGIVIAQNNNDPSVGYVIVAFSSAAVHVNGVVSHPDPARSVDWYND